MGYKSHRYIRVFFDKGPSNRGETKENINPNESPEQETGDILVITKKIYEEFLKQLDRKDALKYINSGYLDIIEALKKENPSLKVNNVEIKKKIDILKNWYGGKSIFDENGVRIPVLATDTEKSIQGSLGIKPKEVVNPEALTQEENEIVDSYLKNFVSKIQNQFPTSKMPIIQDEIISIQKGSQKVSERIKRVLVERLQSEYKKAEIDHMLLSGTAQSMNDGSDSVKNINNEVAANREAAKLTQEKNLFHFSYYSKKAGVYLIKSIKDVSEELQRDVESVDIELYESLVKLPEYKDYLKSSLSREAIAALGLYAIEKPNAPIFRDFSDSREFFAQYYSTLLQQQKQSLTSGEIESYNIEEFPILFPEFSKRAREGGLNIPDAMKVSLMKKDINGFYLELVKLRITNKDVAEYMKSISLDSEKISSGNLKELLTNSKKLGNANLGSFESKFNLTNQADKDRFDTLKNDKVQLGNFRKIDDIEFLLSKIKDKNDTDPFYKSLSLIQTILNDAKSRGEMEYWYNDAMRKDPGLTCSILPDQGKMQAAKKAGELAVATNAENVSNTLSNANSNIPGIEKFDTIPTIEKELKRLRSLSSPTEKDLDEIAILETRLQKKKDIATATHNFITSPGVNQEDAIAVIRGITGSKKSSEEVSQWIKSQEFIHRYGSNENTVSTLEKGAAMMNIGESKTLGSLCKNPENSDFMNCQIVAASNNPFTRTILSPEGEVIVKNIPLDKLSSTTDQLKRFYDSGLGKLAPYMNQIGIAINNSRSDKITGLDGRYGSKEDLNFIKILTIALYGKEKIPTEQNIPNLLRVFNSPIYEESPIFKLKKFKILDEEGHINTLRLEERFKDASKEVK